MTTKPTYEELEKKVKKLENDSEKFKHAEKELRKSEEKFRLLTEKSMVGIYIIQDAKMSYVNPSFAAEPLWQLNYWAGFFRLYLLLTSFSSETWVASLTGSLDTFFLSQNKHSNEISHSIR